ncbi:hypothetical protein [Croceicoccus hydrothermalis]|uniref:hypothetical protein n=1 Tax=Croceicoccus hydrothermalis TaxID=2867964 RepID=UPI001EFB1421|nr:hypothetical protein [Croceicoccus hydrothermalis]
MGRSVSYPSGAIVAFTVIETVSDDAHQNDFDVEYEWLCDDLRERAGHAYPSLIAHDGWRGREDRILMRNAYADFGLSVYGGLVAVWIVERDDGAYRDADWRTARSPRAQRWLSQIAARFEALFGDYICLGHMSNGEGVYRKRDG